MLKIIHPYADSHNGGQLQFGPDGLLWISTGDGGCCGDVEDQARSLGTLLGKLLRINPRARKPGFRVPRTNPLLGLPGRDALMSWGLRNPWRFSFDRLTGNLVIADVGDSGNAQEEVDYVSLVGTRGSNFGWPEYEGFAIRDPGRPASPTPVRPIHSYLQGKRACAITGGYLVRDAGLPQLYGRYLYSDYCTGRLRSFIPPPLDPADPNPPAGVASDDRDEGLFVRYTTSFGEGTNGQIYVASQRGPVYRLQAKRKQGH